MQERIRSISAEEFNTYAQTGEYILIDIRTEMERTPQYGGVIFENSINIDFYKADFMKELDKLDKTKKYLIYCRS
jgi:rhodanese-related sulfurtransferase